MKKIIIPSAFIAVVTLGVACGSIGAYAQALWQPSGNMVVYTNRTTGILTNTPTAALDVNGRSRVRGNATFDSVLTVLYMTAQKANFVLGLTTDKLIVNGTSVMGVVNAPDNTQAIDIGARKLYNSSGGLKIDWEHGQLWNFIGNPPPPPSTTPGLSIDWIARRLYNTAGNIKMDWESGLLYNASFNPGGNISLNWISRDLVGTDGITSTLNWANRNLRGGVWNYDADYSSSYSSRSLVDKQYVDNKVSVIPSSQWTTNPDGTISFNGTAQ